MRKWLKSGTTASQNATCWSAIKAGTRVHVRMIFTDQNITLDDNDISIDSGLVVNDIFNGDTDLVFGKTVCRQVNVRLLNSSRLNGLGWNGEFLLQIYMTISNTEYTCDIGYFQGEKPRNVTTAQYIDLIAYDRMKWFDELADDFLASLTFPKTISQIYTALCTSAGITGVMDSVPASLSGRSFSELPADMEGYTRRDILGWIAEQCGSYATITNDGKCTLRWFSDNTAHAVTGDEEWSVESADLNPGMTHNELDQLTHDELDTMTHNDIDGYRVAYAVDQVLIKQINNDFDINYPSACGGNIYTITDNPFMPIGSNTDVTNYVKPIFDRLSAFGGYLPFEMSCLGDPAVEAGDIITVSIGSVTITVPIFLKTMYWKGDITDEYETTGQTPRATYSSSAQKEQHLDNKRIRLFVENNYYDRKSGIEIEDEGVDISGSKYIRLRSGSELDVESGGSLNVESGGNIDINGSGNLKLSGSTVEIKSGSTFDVDSTNFKISSQTGVFETSGWKLNSDGLMGYVYYDSLRNGAIGIGGTGLFSIPQNTYLLGITGGYSTYSGGTHDLVGYFYLRMQYPDSSREQLKISAGEGVVIDTEAKDSNNNTTSPGGTLGTQAGKWDVWGKTIHYTTMSQNSSRDIKHDIRPMESIGEKLDRLAPVTFVYDDDENEKTRMGMIYENTMEVMPEICTDDESDKAINYVELIPALLKEIQDLRKRVAELERGN